MNRSSRREEAPINFGFRISDFEKRASYSEKGIGGNARPHPAFAGRSQSGHLQQNCYGGGRPGPLPPRNHSVRLGGTANPAVLGGKFPQSLRSPRASPFGAA